MRCILIFILAAATPAWAQDAFMVPIFPPRVIEGPFYNGRHETVLDAAGATYLALVESQQPDLDLTSHYLMRHLSLPVRGHGGTSSNAGLLDALEAQAGATGWAVIPELSLDAGVLYEALALGRDGHVMLVLAYGDAMAPRPDKPGVSLDVAAEAYGCPENIGDPGTDDAAVCPLRGFVPVVLWTDLPAQDAADEPWLRPDPPRSPTVDARLWQDSLTWDEYTQLAAGN